MTVLLVGEASGVGEALDRARVLRPDVVVLDLGLRDGSGLDAIETLREGGTRVVILSMQDEPAYARKAFELGAQGYVIKTPPTTSWRAPSKLCSLTASMSPGARRALGDEGARG
jgi:DNA-binding NarL/FixJ family response regulator